MSENPIEVIFDRTWRVLENFTFAYSIVQCHNGELSHQDEMAQLEIFLHFSYTASGQKYSNTTKLTCTKM